MENTPPISNIPQAEPNNNVLPRANRKRGKLFWLAWVLAVVLAVVLIAIFTSNQWCWGCNVYGSREEITKKAIVKNDPSLCERVGWTDTSNGWPSRKVNLCYMEVAIATKNIEVCKMYRSIPEYSLDMGFNDAQCYLGASQNRAEDYVKCEDIKNPSVKDECYGLFATLLADPSICMSIDNEIEKEKCILYKVLNRGLLGNTEFYKEYCAKVTNPYDEYQCEKFLDPNKPVTAENWKTYAWEYYSGKYVFSYPPNWKVSEVETNYKSNIKGGLFFEPPNSNFNDRILVNRTNCGEGYGDTKCVVLDNIIPISIDTNDPQILKIFDLFIQKAKILSPYTNISNTTSSNWKTFSNAKHGISFEYPVRLSAPVITDSGTRIKIAFENGITFEKGIFWDQGLNRNLTVDDLVNRLMNSNKISQLVDQQDMVLDGKAGQSFQYTDVAKHSVGEIFIQVDENTMFTALQDYGPLTEVNSGVFMGQFLDTIKFSK